MSKFPPCPTCGSVSLQFRIPVWEDMADYEDGFPPDYIGCTECQTMETLEYLRQVSDDE